MKIVRASYCAQGYWSGATEEGEVFMSLETYEKYKLKMPNHTYVSELDGKHSEVRAEIVYDVLSEVKRNPRAIEYMYEWFFDGIAESDEEYQGLIDFDQDIIKEHMVLELTIKKSDYDTVMSLIKEYL